MLLFNNLYQFISMQITCKMCRQALNIGRKMKYLCVPCETFAFFAVKTYRKVRKENAKSAKKTINTILFYQYFVPKGTKMLIFIRH